MSAEASMSTQPVAKAILQDVQFWIPLLALLAGIGLLLWLRS
jgi:hypothetical protein